GWQMDFPSLEKAVTARTRGVVVVHPNNPTGSYVKAEEFGLLNAFCRERGLALIVDEVFLDYRLDVGTAAPGCPVERSSTVPDAESNTRSLHAPGDRRSQVHRLGRDDRAEGFASFVGSREVLTFTL